MIDPVEPHPERLRLQELIGFADRRLERAIAKRRAAQDEVEAASAQLVAAGLRLDAWDEANPDPQPDLPMEAPCPKP